MYDDDQNRETGAAGNSSDEALLQEIRSRYTYAKAAWKDIQEERRIDMRFIGGDPWDPTERKARENAESRRPCLSWDELSQYRHQAINSLRQNPRGIKVDPVGDGANDKTAELEQDQIRTIEYRSNATSAYVTGYQAALDGGYGFWRLSRRYVYNGDDVTEENADHQEMVIKNIANPDSVLYDPDCKDADWGDARYCFVLNPIPRDEFKRRWPKARITDFSADQMRVASDWISAESVLTAEYWRAETTEVKKFGRTMVKRQIVQYITNGVEILDEHPEPEGAEIIPIIPTLGEELYVDDGGGPKRRLVSLVRLAREPQMSLAYLVSQEAEEAGLTPKSPFLGYTGQFETDRVRWENVTKIPAGFLQADPVVDAASGQLLPLPTRIPFTPNFQQYEIAKDSARRAIQAAMGISPLPTAAQRSNQKSGVALDRIEQQESVGSFHFLDNFCRALMLTGRAIDERREAVYGQDDREEVLITADGKHRKVKLNTAQPYYDDESKEQVHYQVGLGKHAITISTGPSEASARRAADDFVDLLIKELEGLPISPQQKAQIVAIGIQMKNLGAKGDQLAKIISPPNQGQIPPEAQQAIGQAHQLVTLLQGELQKLQAEKQGKVVDNQYKMAIEQMRIEADLAKAEILTKAQSMEERLRFVEDAWKQLHGQAHDAGLQAQDQAHAADQQQQQLAAQQQAAQQQPEPAAA